MTVALGSSDRAADLAPAARLLAHWWSRPTVEEVAAWEAVWPPAHEAATQLGLDSDDVGELQAAVDETGVDAFLAEYERLFVGPGRAPCAPYESLWRDDRPRRERGTLMGAPAADVVALYRELGLQVRGDAHELPDHLVIEWEALACALEQGATDVSCALARAHLGTWIEPFCAAVGSETELGFYRTLARFTPVWAAALTR